MTVGGYTLTYWHVAAIAAAALSLWLILADRDRK
jgi:hypothetical protein